MAHGNWRSIAPKSFSVGVPLALGGEVTDYRQLGSTSWALALAIPEQRAPGSIRAVSRTGARLLLRCKRRVSRLVFVTRLVGTHRV